MKIRTSNTRFMKHIIWQSRSEKWNTVVAAMSERWSTAGTRSWHILGWCHINFIKPKTYPAILPPKAYDSLHFWNEFMRVTKHFPQSIFRLLRCMHDTFLYHLMWIKCVYLSPVTFFTLILNIMICNSRNLRQQKRTFEQICSKFYKTRALTSTCNKNLNFATIWMICDHRHSKPTDHV